MIETKKLKGFAAMTPERRTEIARLGQKAITERGTRYKWTKEKAVEASLIAARNRRNRLAQTA